MREQPEIGDPFGEALLDAAAGGRGEHFVERDDGYLRSEDARHFLARPAQWPPFEREALGTTSGRVLDIGAGAGRHSLALQNRGCDPVAMDMSPGAIEVCRSRGVNTTFIGTVFDLEKIDVEPFDYAVMLGNNLGLLQSDARAGHVLDAIGGLLKPGGLVVGTLRDPYMTDAPHHLRYHDLNRAAGRYPGQIRLRLRYGRTATEWFQLLFLSPQELVDLAGRCGWRVIDMSEPRPDYVAVLSPF